jgi:hypothetical protein
LVAKVSGPAASGFVRNLNSRQAEAISLRRKQATNKPQRTGRRRMIGAGEELTAGQPRLRLLIKKYG